jgi:hypothetical protein
MDSGTESLPLRQSFLNADNLAAAVLDATILSNRISGRDSI